MTEKSNIRLSHTVACAGCAAKLSPILLREALKAIPPSKIQDPNLLVGANTLDDAGVYLLSKDLAIIATTDFFPPIVDDPELFGKIAATNAMSDVYAMGGEVKTVLNIVSFPKALPLEMLGSILKGAQAKVDESGGVIVGGHTVATDTLLFGLAVTGIINPKDMTTNAAAKEGDVLILTKPLGTGIITTAIKFDAISVDKGEEAFFNMTLLNAEGARIMRRYGIRSATDITGFGLLGHSMQMAEASGVTFEIEAHKVPIMDGVLELIEKEMLPGALENNAAYAGPKVEHIGKIREHVETALLDPQTSGGLLMSVPEQKSNNVLKDLHKAGYSKATIIGRVVTKKDRPIVLKGN